MPAAMGSCASKAGDPALVSRGVSLGSAAPLDPVLAQQLEAVRQSAAALTDSVRGSSTTISAGEVGLGAIYLSSNGPLRARRLLGPSLIAPSVPAYTAPLPRCRSASSVHFSSLAWQLVP